MKRALPLAGLLLACGLSLHAVFPEFYGPRGLSLGYSIFASGWDVNAVYLNPAALAETRVALSAYQFQQSNRDYRGFEDNLQAALDQNLSGFDGLSAARREDAVAALDRLWDTRHGVSGHTARMPALVSRNFGLAIAWVKAGRMEPAATEAFRVPAGDWTSTQVESLTMRFTGIEYRQFSLAYAMDLTRSMRLGVGLHYLTGRGTRFEAPLTGSPFAGDADIRDLTRYAWSQPGTKFNRIMGDLSLVMSLGPTFQGVVMVKNLGNPDIKLDSDTLELPQRIIAGLAFRPSGRLAVYLNMDLKATDMWFDGSSVQPLSAGIEASFYQQRVFFRAGIWNDLQEKYFLGKRSNVQYGLGLGFRMNRVVLDVGMALDAAGSVSGLAVSAAFWMQ